MKKEIKQKEAFIEVSTTILGKPKEEVKKIKIRPFATDTANVGVKYGVTIPTGDYSSLRVDVMVNCPCYVEEMVPVFNQCCKLAEKLMDRETDRLFKEKKK